MTIVGVQENGWEGLAPAARAAIDAADIIFGGPRHLALIDAGAHGMAGRGLTGRGREWPRPFSIAPVIAARGAKVVVLASGDPFCHGTGTALAAALDAGEWISLPAPSTFSLAANRLGWPLESTICRAIHAAPVETLADDLTPGARLIVLVRDGAAVDQVARDLDHTGTIARIRVLERLGGPQERITDHAPGSSPAAPVALAIEVVRSKAHSIAPGRPVDTFAHDGQITKPLIRAATLAALAPRAGEMLWDLGAGSGSVSVEWCRLGGHAIAVECQAPRCANIACNIARHGLSARLRVIESDHRSALPDLPAPDAIFVGGGFDAALFQAIRATAPGARLVVNAVTLETEAFLVQLSASHGGSLTRIDISQAAPLGPVRGWQPARPVIQWSLP